MKTLLESINNITESLNGDGKKLLKKSVDDLNKLGIKPDRKKLEAAVEKLSEMVKFKDVLEFWVVEDAIAKDLIREWGAGLTIDGEHILAVKCGTSEIYSYNGDDNVWEEF